MLESKQVVIKKILPFDANYVEAELKNIEADILRWAVVKVTEENFIVDFVYIK